VYRILLPGHCNKLPPGAFVVAFAIHRPPLLCTIDVNQRQVDALLIKGAPQPPGSGVIAPALHGTAALAVVLVLVALVAAAIGICEGSIYGEAALMPDSYTRATVLGEAASGVNISILRIVTKAALSQTGDGLRIATILYFTLAAFIAAACVFTYEFIMPHLDVVASCRQRLQGAQQYTGHCVHSAWLCW
jgi:Nucleoside transporter